MACIARQVLLLVDATAVVHVVVARARGCYCQLHTNIVSTPARACPGLMQLGDPFSRYGGGAAIPRGTSKTSFVCSASWTKAHWPHDITVLGYWHHMHGRGIQARTKFFTRGTSPSLATEFFTFEAQHFRKSLPITVSPGPRMPVPVPVPVPTLISVYARGQCMYVCVCARARACVCVCVRVSGVSYNDFAALFCTAIANSPMHQTPLRPPTATPRMPGDSIFSETWHQLDENEYKSVHWGAGSNDECAIQYCAFPQVRNAVCVFWFKTICGAVGLPYMSYN